MTTKGFFVIRHVDAQGRRTVLEVRWYTWVLLVLVGFVASVWFRAMTMTCADYKEQMEFELEHQVSAREEGDREKEAFYSRRLRSVSDEWIEQCIPK